MEIEKTNIELSLPLHTYYEKLQSKVENSKQMVWDPIRRKYLVLTKEEMVRQLLIHYLVEQKGISINKIAVEKQLIVNDLEKRCDLIIYNESFQPSLLIECKAPSIPINNVVFEQVSTYNRALKVPFLLVTNGISTMVAKIDYETHSYTFLNDIPTYADLNNAAS